SMYRHHRCPPIRQTTAKVEHSNVKSPTLVVSPARPRTPTTPTHTEFSTLARNHEHHPNLVGITSSRRTVFVPLFTFLILACLDDPHPQNLKSGISNLRSSPCGAGALARELVQSEISNLNS